MANTKAELQQLQGLPLAVKIKKTEQRIKEWVDYWGEDGVYVSFSGGKDSTVLLDICRKMYPNMRAMFVDIPTQFPELRKFVATFENVDIEYPEMGFIEVVDKYGFPLISKEVSNCVGEGKKWLEKARLKEKGLLDSNDKITNSNYIADLLGIPRRGEDKNNKDFKKLKNGEIPNLSKIPIRLQLLEGVYHHKGEKSKYTKEKWLFLIDAPFNISDKCCKIMKKKPAHQYTKKTGRQPITAQMTSESRLRTQKWLQNGCNSFEGTSKISNPMSFWTEQDILLYIKLNNLPICSVYGDIVEDVKEDEVEGQMTISDIAGFEDMALFDAERPLLKTTGCNRTGCVLCGFGCHLEKGEDRRFVNLKQTHEGLYNLLDKCTNNGYTYRQAIDWVNKNSNGKVHIDY